MPKENKNLKRYYKNAEWQIFTGMKADKEFSKALAFHFLYLNDVSVDQMVELINARAKLIQKLFTFQDLTDKIRVIKYD